jgi:hypothetical protein
MVSPNRPRIPITRKDLRGTRFGDVPAGEDHWHIIRSSNLTQELRTRIEAADLTEHELLRKIVIELRILNKHLTDGSDEDITMKDIEWP